MQPAACVAVPSDSRRAGLALDFATRPGCNSSTRVYWFGGSENEWMGGKIQWVIGHPYLWWENPWISLFFSRNRQKPEAIAGMPLATYILASFAADVVGMPGERCFRIPERLIVLRLYKSTRSYTAVAEDTSGFFNFCWFTGSLYPSLAWVNHDGIVIEQSLPRECLIFCV